MSWRFVELCCGSAAVTLHLLGARRPPLPYQGSKWRFRRQLAECFAVAGFEGVPGVVQLTDPGPWGTVAPAVLEPGRRAQVLGALRAFAAEDPRAVYDRLHRHPVPDDPIAFSAQYLFLQRLAYSGKAVGTSEGRWSSPGFNSSSAYGLAGTERFGRVNPMIPSLIRVLEGYGALEGARIESARARASLPAGTVSEPTVVYLDPPYAGSTRYPDGDLDRDGVVALARAWKEAGATVFVSEAEALPSLVDQGWSAVCLTTGRDDTSPFRGKQQEWVTWA